MHLILILIGFTLVYFLIGALYLLAYILVFKPQAKDAQLGLTMLFWWVYLIIEVVLSIAVNFGSFGRSTAAKLTPEKKRQ